MDLEVTCFQCMRVQQGVCSLFHCYGCGKFLAIKYKFFQALADIRILKEEVERLRGNH